MPRSLPTVLNDTLAALRELLHPPVRLEWNHDPAAIVIQASSAWPRRAPALALNALPDALVWGDGRIVWTEAGRGGSRRVQVGRMATAQLGQLLEQIRRAGFFRMKRWYPADAAQGPFDRTLSVHLVDRSHEVCARDGAGPRSFVDLYRLVTSGAGVAGLPYRPKEAFLVATPARRSANRRLPAWDAAATGLRLDEAAQGVWVHATALEAAWKLVNARPTDPRVTQGSRAYVLTLQVPEIITWEPRLP